jgi:hypothetical protein
MKAPCGLIFVAVAEAGTFSATAANLRAAQSAEQRAELLRRMNAPIVIEELNQLILANQSSLDSNLASIAPSSWFLPRPQGNIRHITFRLLFLTRRAVRQRVWDPKHKLAPWQNGEKSYTYYRASH